MVKPKNKKLDKVSYDESALNSDVICLKSLASVVCSQSEQDTIEPTIIIESEVVHVEPEPIKVKKVKEKKAEAGLQSITSFFKKKQAVIIPIVEPCTSVFQSTFQKFDVKANIVLFKNPFYHHVFGDVMQCSTTIKSVLDEMKLFIQTRPCNKSRLMKLYQFAENFRPPFYGILIFNIYIY